MEQNMVKMVQIFQIQCCKSKINRFDENFDEYQKFEISINPAKELTELFCKNAKFSNPTLNGSRLGENGPETPNLVL